MSRINYLLLILFISVPEVSYAQVSLVDKCTFKWDPGTNVTEYNLGVGTAPGVYDKTFRTANTTATCSDLMLSSGPVGSPKSYYANVHALRGSISGEWSDEVPFTLVQSINHGPPTLDLSVIGEPVVGKSWSVMATTDAPAGSAVDFSLNRAYFYTDYTSNPFCMYPDVNSVCTMKFMPKGKHEVTGTVYIPSPAGLIASTSKTITVDVTDPVIQLSTLAVSPASLSFSVLEGGPSTTSTFSVSNSGTVPLTYSLSSSSSWISFSSSATTLQPSQSNTHTVTVSSGGLTPSSYSGNVVVTSTGASNSPITIPATLIITPAPKPTISVAPVVLNYSGNTGTSIPKQTVHATNIGSGSLNISVTSDSSWISLVKSSNFFDVMINSSGLTAGSYKGSVKVTDPLATNSPVTIPVNLTLSEVKPIFSITNNSEKQMTITWDTAKCPGGVTKSQNRVLNGKGSFVITCK